ncbi:alcohol dehydrogenase catalytic domain-containing protein [Methylobacterium planeticum]|uniref:Alcohol dehydrogenase catalytic domain-containing protein n=1 Tax=Methylobacterium planeticum TaxID=2615211 RepID=A0A6N6N164_9HYPH|nr:alcohol dehydrogenase catalytic domain-containing protein [Methylobacterium planeticum]
MRALVWHGTQDIRRDTVSDPQIEHERDAIIKITACAICGSDPHLCDHVMPGRKSGDIMGHERMSEVVETGRGVGGALKEGDRIVVAIRGASRGATRDFVIAKGFRSSDALNRFKA